MASTPHSQDQATAPAVLRSRHSRVPLWPLQFYHTALGKKAVMAVTAMVLLGYVLVHMLGNLKIYGGEEDLNHYGEWLRTIGQPALPHSGALWIMRILLIVCFALHIHAAFALTAMNRKARGTGYKGGRDYVSANFASLTMRWSGVIVLVFVIFHLMDLTWGNANPDFRSGEPYHNVVESLSRPGVAAFYVAANLFLGMQIFHGAWSMFQSLGWGMARFKQWRRYFAMAFAAVIVIGNISFPIAVMTGIVE